MYSKVIQLYIHIRLSLFFFFHPVVFLQKVKMMPSSHTETFTCPETHGSFLKFLHMRYQKISGGGQQAQFFPWVIYDVGVKKEVGI